MIDKVFENWREVENVFILNKDIYDSKICDGCKKISTCRYSSIRGIQGLFCDKCLDTFKSIVAIIPDKRFCVNCGEITEGYSYILDELYTAYRCNSCGGLIRDENAKLDKCLCMKVYIHLSDINLQTSNIDLILEYAMMNIYKLDNIQKPYYVVALIDYFTRKKHIKIIDNILHHFYTSSITFFYIINKLYDKNTDSWKFEFVIIYPKILEPNYKLMKVNDRIY